MPRLLETISLRNGTLENLEYHQQRVDKALQHFKSAQKIHLQTLLQDAPITKEQLRCRIVYNNKSIDISYHPYKVRDFKTFKLIELPSSFEYSFKYANREYFDTLHTSYPEYDEFILHKDGLVVECSIANLAFEFEGRLYTPQNVLLKGTMREKLLNEKKIITKDISLQSIQSHTTFYMLNAMLGSFKINNAIIS